MPDPIVSGDGYHVRIAEVGADRARCSDSFYLITPSEADEWARPWIMVVSPTSDSVALAGEEYTVEVRSHSCHTVPASKRAPAIVLRAWSVAWPGVGTKEV